MLYNHDTNSIPALPIPNRQATTLCDAWESTYKVLIKQGHPPNLHILDNKLSKDLKNAFLKYDIDYQQVPLKEHRANAAERAIRTFKNHLVAILCSFDSNFLQSSLIILHPSVSFGSRFFIWQF